LRFRFKVAARADRQIRAAAKWWAKNRTAAPALFTEDLESAFSLIEEFPYAGEEIPHRRILGLRRVLLGRSQYHLYYTAHLSDHIVEVLALWHSSRGKPPRM
jgi:plasmid stabilization system protein ParE